MILEAVLASAGTPMDAALILLISLGLAALCFVLLAAEFYVISGGILGLLALCSAVGAAVVGYQAHPFVAYGLALAMPLGAMAVVRWGLKRMPNSRMAAQGEIKEHAGASHILEEAGISIGNEGVMCTPAHPTGRARFGTREIDVHAGTRSLAPGDTVRVVACDGAVVRVVHLAPQTSQNSAS